MENRKMSERNKLVIYKVATFVLFCTTIILLVDLFSEFSTNEVLNDKINVLYQRDSLNTRILDSDSVISYRIKNGKVVTYKQLSEENVSLKMELDSCKDELSLIKKNYPIRVIRNGNIISVKSEQIDSALYLLDMYRDKITYDKKQKAWIVTR